MPHNLEMRRRFIAGFISGVVGAGLWGVSGTCAQFLFATYGITPLFSTVVRSFFASIAFFAAIFVARRTVLNRMATCAKVTKIALLVFGLCLFVDQFACMTAVALTNAGTATVLQMLGTVFVMLYTCLVGRRLPRAIEAAGLVLALVATFLIATQGDPTTLVLPAAGLFWGILNAFSVAVYVLVPRYAHLFEKFGSFPVTAVGMLVTFVLSTVVYLITMGPQMFVAEVALLDTRGWLALIGGLTFLGTFLSFWLYLRGVSLVGSITGSLLGAVEPASAMMFSALLLGTVFTGADWIGLILMVGMLVLVTFSDGDDGTKPQAD